MWLKTIVLLRSLRILAEFVNKLPWHHVCQPVNRNFDRKTSLISLNQVLEPEFDLSPRASCSCRVLLYQPFFILNFLLKFLYLQKKFFIEEISINFFLYFEPIKMVAL